MKKTILTLLFCIGVVSVFGQSPSISIVLNHPACNNDGVVTATVTGLTPPVYVLWSTPSYDFAPGHYKADTIVSNSQNSVVWSQYDGQPITFSASDNYGNTIYSHFTGPEFKVVHGIASTAICPDTTGSINLTISGGTPPYTYTWYGHTGALYSPFPNPDTIASTTNPASLPVGLYNVMVTDNNGCQTTYYGNSQVDSLEIKQMPGFTYTLTTTDANCTNGTATISGLIGGHPPFTYLWGNNATTPVLNNLIAGYYPVTVTDAAGCSLSKSGTVAQTTAINVNVLVTNATCLQSNGSIIPYTTGGMPPYTYTYTSIDSTITNTTGVNMAAGVYIMGIKDANGCFGTVTGGDNFVDIAATTPISVTYTMTPTACNMNSGTISLSITGGQPPYNVAWSQLPALSGTSLSNLASGSYHFTVTDANGCQQTGYIYIPVSASIQVTTTVTNDTCGHSLGSIRLAGISGGTAPYTFAWNNGSSDSLLQHLAAGIVDIFVTDANGCSGVAENFISSIQPDITLSLSASPATAAGNDGSVTATYTGALSPYSYYWVLPDTAFHALDSSSLHNLSPGSYSFHIQDSYGCFINSEIFVPGPPPPPPPPAPCSVSGLVFADLNGNCILDPGEQGIPNIQIHTTGQGYTYTDQNGSYLFTSVPANGAADTITENAPYYYQLASCQSNNVVVVTDTSGGCYLTANFANTSLPVHQLSMGTWDFTYPIPGYPYSQINIISNDGTVTETAATSGFHTDGQLGSASFTPSSVTGSGNQYNESGIAIPYGTSFQYLASYNVPTNIPLLTPVVFDDTASYTTPISNWAADLSPWNNINHFVTYTTGSYDPNFVEVNPQGTGTPGYISTHDSILTYMVHFQNTGTYYALNITVTDTLDADLDWTTMRPQYSLFPATVTMSDQGVIHYTFSGINLPWKSLTEAGSNGMFTFTIKTKHNLPAGTQFTNSAAVYFDYNEPVSTNSTLNTLGEPTGISSVPAMQQGMFTIYPNPAGNMFNASIYATADGTATLKLTDLSGKVLSSRNITVQSGMQTIPVNTTTFAAGVYFVNLYMNGSVSTQKLVIIK